MLSLNLLGVVITREDVKKAVASLIEVKKSELEKDRYLFPIPSMLITVRDQLKWADSKDIKEEVDAQVLALLGPKNKDDEERVSTKEI